MVMNSFLSNFLENIFLLFALESQKLLILRIKKLILKTGNKEFSSNCTGANLEMEDNFFLNSRRK
jgi:hypothetical protein